MPSIRTKAQIDAVAETLRRVGGEQLDIPVSDLLEKFLIADGLGAIGEAVGCVDEHQVDVRTVIQFLATELTKGDDGETTFARLAIDVDEERDAVAYAQFAADTLEGRFEHGIREV